MRRGTRRALLALVAGAWVGVTWWQSAKPLPPGTRLASPVCAVPPADATFIADISAADAYGHAVGSQGIFDEVLRVVGGAQRFIVLDYSRFGAAAPGAPPPQRALAAQLTEALLARRRERPQLAVLFIVDPTNEDFGAAPAPELARLRQGGVDVVAVNLDALRDPNLLYSGLWRLALSWWEEARGPGGGNLRRLNFKSDHRKLLLADDGAGGLSAVVGSANPLDAQSAWSNTALRLHGGALPALLASELAVARFSGWRGNAAAFVAEPDTARPACAGEAPAEGDFARAASLRMQLLSEGEIRDALLAHTEAAGVGDGIDIAAHYLAERSVVESLLAAARRGVSVRLILDPNEDASASGGSGIPNQPLAGELVSRSGGAIHVRWYRTHGERFHSALALVYDRSRVWLIAGSADLTRRSLDDYNLEADVALEALRTAPLAQQTLDYFEALWGNKAALGIEYTADYAAFADPGQADYWLCRALEGLGSAPF